VSIGADARSAFANKDTVNFKVAVSGGVEPYTYYYIASCEGAEAAAAESGDTFTFAPARRGDYKITVTVTDSQGATESASCALPVAADERETRAQWEKTLPGLSADMTFAQKVAAVAKSQEGYRENTHNFIIRADGTRGNYTRYGDWYGKAYEDWNAMFAAFCLRYAGVPASVLPTAADAGAWKTDLADSYIDDERAYSPLPGDIVFLHVKGGAHAQEANYPNRVGVVVAVSENGISTIEGDCDGAVRAGSYVSNDARIVGYVSVAALSGASEKNYEATETYEAPAAVNDETNAVISATSVNVRADATVESDKAGFMAGGEHVNALARTVNEAGETWYLIGYGSLRGYVRADLIDVTGDVPELGAEEETEAPVEEAPVEEITEEATEETTEEPVEELTEETTEEPAEETVEETAEETIEETAEETVEETTDEPAEPETLTEETPAEQTGLELAEVGLTMSWTDEYLVQGSLVTLTANVQDAGTDYRLFWECDRGEGWEEIPGVEGTTYTFTLDAETLTYRWRAGIVVE